MQYNPEWLVKDFKQAPWACPDTSTYLTCSFVYHIQKIKEFILGFLPGTTLPPTLQSSVKVDIVSPSQHKQDTLSVSSVLSAVSAAGHEDEEGTGQKTGWEFLKRNSVLDIYEKTRLSQGRTKLVPTLQATQTPTLMARLPLSRDAVGMVVATQTITSYPALFFLPQGLKTQRKT